MSGADLSLLSGSKILTRNPGRSSSMMVVYLSFTLMMSHQIYGLKVLSLYDDLIAFDVSDVVSDL